MKMKNPRMTASETKKVDFEIEDLIKMIDNEEKKTKAIGSPKFTLAGVQFSIRVYPEKTANYIGVFVMNESNEDQTVSFAFKSPIPDTELGPFNMQVIEKGWGWGSPDYMTHEEYKSWANENGDVFKLEVTATLQIKEKPAVESTITLRGTESFSKFGTSLK